MLRIRLTRIGKKKQPYFRIVVMDKRSKVQGAYVESLGWYDPRVKKVNIKEDKVKEWMAKGAQPSSSLAVLLKKEGLKLPGWVAIKKRNPKPKKEKAAQKSEVKSAPIESKEEVVEGKDIKTEETLKEDNQTQEVEANQTQIDNAEQPKNENAEQVIENTDQEVEAEKT